MTAHVGGLPIEETLGIAPALLMAVGVAAARLRVRLHREPDGETHSEPIAAGPGEEVVPAAEGPRAMRAPKIAAAVAVTAALLALVTPAVAVAAVTCDYSSGGKLLTVALNEQFDNAQMGVVSGEIKVAEGVTSVTCTGPGGPPSVTNTGAISVTGSGDGFQKIGIVNPDDFAPGPEPQDGSDSGGGTKEIEIFVNLNRGPSSTLEVVTEEPARIVFGTGGINTNPVGEAFRDADIFPSNVERLAGVGGSGPDELNARGGAGTGGPLSDGIFLLGDRGSDQLEGGEGADSLHGGPGGDTLFGGGGDDVLVPGAGNDVANGALGDDTVDVTPSGQPATIDLAVALQDTGDGLDTLIGFENARSETTRGATLRGDDGPNVLTGTEGDDTLEGRGGIDVLSAGPGRDAMQVRDGEVDRAACDEDVDTVTADLRGLDLLTNCENVIFPPPLPPPPQPPSPVPGGGEARSVQASTAVFGARTLVTLALARERVPARGPLAVRVSNANGFDVRGALSGRTTGRLSVAQKKRRIGLGSRSFTVTADARETVRVKLPRPLRRAIARKGRLSLRLSATVRDPAGTTRTVQKTLRPRLRRR